MESSSLLTLRRTPPHLSKLLPPLLPRLPSRVSQSQTPLKTSLRTRRLALRAAASASPDPVAAPTSPFEGSSASGAPAQGLYSAKVYDLTVENVDRVLDDVRPYLISDGGNVDVVSVEDGIISLKLQGACGSCPSSTTTMTMGIERVLKEKFGDAIKDIQQVNDKLPTETTAEAVNNHLDILRPAISNYGGSVEVLSVDGQDCLVKYVGPESIGSGIKAAIKERFPDIANVIFTA